MIQTAQATTDSLTRSLDEFLAWEIKISVTDLLMLG